MLKYGIPEQKYGEYGAHYNNSKYGKKSNRARLYIKSAFVFMLTASIIIWMNSIPIGAFDGADSFSDIASEQEWEMLKEVNAGRIKADLSPLTITKEMQNAAGKRVIELSSSFSHERPGGSVGYTAIKREGVSYDAAAENIAAGKDDASVIFSGLMKSEENKKNILLPYSSHIGIGYEEAKGSEYGHYWVQLFIK